MAMVLVKMFALTNKEDTSARARVFQVQFDSYLQLVIYNYRKFNKDLIFKTAHQTKILA